MTERSLSRRQADDELEWIDTDEELEKYLSSIAPYVGWVIIYFNSLEDHIADFIRMAVLRDWIQDERLDVFLAGMLFCGESASSCGFVRAADLLQIRRQDRRGIERLSEATRRVRETTQRVCACRSVRRSKRWVCTGEVKVRPRRCIAQIPSLRA